jgi:hypothetical protein
MFFLEVDIQGPNEEYDGNAQQREDDPEDRKEG